MPTIIIHNEKEGAFKDYAERKIIHLGEESPPIRIASLEKGMTSGKPSVAIGIELPTGELVLAETSLVLFLNAADILRARFQ